MGKKVAIIHTFLYSVEDLKALFKKYIPGVEIINIIDDSLLQEALANKGITNNARSRYVKYAEAAQSLGVDCILNQCSSYGECADYAAKAVNIPIIKIDAPMAKKANKIGKKITVIKKDISANNIIKRTELLLKPPCSAKYANLQRNQQICAHKIHM